MKALANDPVVLVVVEFGARWPAWIDRHRSGEDTAVFAQQPSESSRALTQRVLRAADQMAARNRCIQTVVLSLDEGASWATRSQRARIARSLVRCVCKRSGAFVLCIGEPTADERHELLTLCGSLTEGLHRTGVAVIAVLDSPLPDPDRAQPNDWKRSRELSVRAAPSPSTDLSSTVALRGRGRQA